MQQEPATPETQKAGTPEQDHRTEGASFNTEATHTEATRPPVGTDMPKTHPLTRAIGRSWRADHRRRSFVWATGLTFLLLALSCSLGTRPIANSVGLDQPSYQPKAGNDQQALRMLIDHVCNTHNGLPNTPCVIGVRAALFRAFQVSKADIDRQVHQGNTPFAAINIFRLGCPEWEQSMTRLVVALSDLVKQKSISPAQSDEIIAWFQARQDVACSFVSNAGTTLLTPTPGPGFSHSCPPVPGHEDADVEVRLLATVNQARANAGVAPLNNDLLIHRVALTHSEDMTCYGMSHFVPPGTTPATRMAAAGVQFTWHGENIGWAGVGSDWQKVMWLFNTMMAEQPPNDGHRQNILSPHFNRTGIGIYVENASGRLWLTEDFAG